MAAITGQVDQVLGPQGLGLPWASMTAMSWDCCSQGSGAVPQQPWDFSLR